jgi:hypothetical protein
MQQREQDIVLNDTEQIPKRVRINNNQLNNTGRKKGAKKQKKK